jgi:Asp-tRNA(Asn)/Glu-tRNA(Gln) amidotransferase C subunit
LTKRHEDRVDSDLIRRLEALAGLRLRTAEREALAGQLDRIVTFVAQLQQLDGVELRLPEVESAAEGPAGVLAAEHPVEAPAAEGPDASPRRADRSDPSLPRQEVLAQAPDTDGCFFIVPPVFLPEPGPWPGQEKGASDE